MISKQQNNHNDHSSPLAWPFKRMRSADWRLGASLEDASLRKIARLGVISPFTVFDHMPFLPSCQSQGSFSAKQCYIQSVFVKLHLVLDDSIIP